MKIKAPRFLDNLYRDMRDRRLLLPAAALLVALIAVPFVLKKDVEPAPVLPPSTAAADTTAVTSAVLVDDTVDIRDYKKRLAKLKSKNPFMVNVSVATPGGDGGNGGSGGAGGDTATGDTSTGAPPSTDTGTPPTGAPATSAPDTSTDVSSGSPTTPPDDTTDTEPDQTQPEIRFLAGRVDITMGPLGKAREYDNVKYLTYLPDDAKPIATFVGLTEQGSGKAAVFAISPLVEVGDGEGSCSPHKPDPCQFLTLRVGEQRFLKLDGKTYRLKVRNTELVEIKDPREQNSEGDDSATDGTTDGGDDSPGGQQP